MTTSSSHPGLPGPAAAVAAGLHPDYPDCPGGRRLAPTPADAALRAAAARQQEDALERERLSSAGFSRLRVLAGGPGVGVAAG